MDNKTNLKSQRPITRRTSQKNQKSPPRIVMSKWQIILIVGIFVVIIAAVFSIPYYINYIAPFNRTIMTIDDTKINMREFLKRSLATGQEPMTLLGNMTEEIIIGLKAPELGIVVTGDDIDRQLRANSAVDGQYLSDVEFREWYRQLLNENSVSNSEYRKIISDNLLKSRLELYLQQRVSDTGPQVRLSMIATQTLEEAQAAVNRVNTGEDFAAVAKEVSIDTTGQESGGDVGWVALGGLPTVLDTYEDIISKLEVNEVSSPVAYYSSTSTSSSDSSYTEPEAFFVFQVTEKDPARILDDTSYSTIQSKALDTWYNEEIKNHQVKYNFTSAIYAWLNYELEKSSPSTGTSTTTSS